jgi:hypothetical protein
MRQAQTTTRWLSLVAEHYGVPVVAMARTLGTPQALAVEAARLLHTAAQRTAERLVSADEKPPTGGDLLDRLTRAYYAPLMDAKKAQVRAQSKKAIDAELKSERQAKKKIAKEPLDGAPS